METAEYQRMFEMEDTHWWFQSRYDLTSRVLERAAAGVDGKPIRHLDMGCGTGMFLERQGDRRETYGLDFSTEGLRFSSQRGLKRLVCADSQEIPFASNSFDIVTAFDLIEHVPHDDKLVAEVHRILRPGGFLLATVPAHPMLWSPHDIALHHMRRYRKKEFGSLFKRDLWEKRRFTYSFFAIYLPATGVRLMKRVSISNGHAEADTRTTPALLNSMLKGLHQIENAWLERLDAPIGLSLMTVQEKR